MFVYIGISVIILIIAFVVFKEYKNNKRYKEERYHKPSNAEKKAKEQEEAQKLKEELERKKEAAHREIARREEENKAEEERKRKAQAEKLEAQRQKEATAREEEEARKKEAKALEEAQAQKKEESLLVTPPPAPSKALPACDYPPFTHIRLIEMGLSDEEAVDFVVELVPQLEEQIEPIQIALKKGDFHQVERYTHGVKGSATNIGTGGIADLLVDWNTYLKSGTDIDIINHYLNYYVEYTEKLKQQYA